MDKNNTPEIYRRFKRAKYLSDNNPGFLERFSRIIRYSLSAGPQLAATILGINALFTDSISSRLKIVDERTVIFALEAFGVIVLASLALRLLDILIRFPETRRKSIFKEYLFLRQSVLPSTRKFLEDKKLDNDAVGGAVEVFSHPANDARLEDNGWAAEQVEIRGTWQDFRIPEQLRSDEKIPGENGTVFCLSDYREPFKDDSENLELLVKKTDWVKFQRSVRIVSKEISLRHDLSNIHPKFHKIPSSLCLHFVCLTSDNYFLALKRKSGTPFYPNAMSISFEEQLSQRDFEMTGSRMKAWFLRAICEEVLPLTGLHERDPQTAVRIAEENIRFYRIWSCFFEELTGNFSLFGVVKLNIELSKLLRVFDELKATWKTKHDAEGRMYFMTPDEVDSLLLSGHSTATPLLRPQDGPESIGELHPTALYRASLVRACMD